LIKIRNLTKRYERLTAVDNLSLNIQENEIFGLLGPNGAGKTTVIHMLATLLKPTSGSATVNGYDIISQSAKVRSSIGIVTATDLIRTSFIDPDSEMRKIRDSFAQLAF
jgi:ABC-2 type transport system ATP-binding protein